jgi:uncharacterized protein
MVRAGPPRTRRRTAAPTADLGRCPAGHHEVVTGHRLADAASIYLRQHADNPVDWWPWSDEAFAHARDRDVPVLLSVGYASCHWCHVMAHESFEDAATAAQINTDFVAIKVDREERPDVDAAYMTATQALTGSGGWPMTCFLTPDRVPFYAGTYFPPRPRPGMPAFRQVLSAIADTWRDDRANVLAGADRILKALREITPAGGGELPDADTLAAAATEIVGSMDLVRGGFRGAPKFPPAMICEFLLRHAERTGSAPARDAVDVTLEAMARGGLYDQLAGGFARYSVDNDWHVPHFEKMLDDNALLLRLYAHHARRTGSALSARVARSTGEFLLTGLRTPDGLFAAALDADVDGVEGAGYVWTDEQLTAVLGADAPVAARWFAADGLPSAEVDGHVLRLPADPDDPERFEHVRARLLAARDRRPQPGRDDIVPLRSNALAIAALAEAGAGLGIAGFVDAAHQALDRLQEWRRRDGGWAHSWLHGDPGTGPAGLADLAGLAAAMLAVHQARPVPGLLERATELLDQVLRDFGDGAGGVREPSRTELPVDAHDPLDQAAPGGTSTLADALVTAAALTGRDDLRAAADRIVAQVGAVLQRVPRAGGWYLAVAEAMVAGPLQVAVATDDPAGELAVRARTRAPGGAVLAVGRPDSEPLLADRPLRDGRSTAYVCRGFVCDRPVTSADDLEVTLTTQG